MMSDDQTFARIEALFDVKLFADVNVLIAGCGSGAPQCTVKTVAKTIAVRSIAMAGPRGPGCRERITEARRRAGRRSESGRRCLLGSSSGARPP